MMFVRQQPVHPSSPCGPRSLHPTYAHCGPAAHPRLFFFQSQPDEAEAAANETDKNKSTPSEESNERVIYRKAMNHVAEDVANYTLSFDLPGVKEQDVSVQVENGVLHVSAERKASRSTTIKFKERFAIDETAAETTKIHADLSDGVLTVTIPKKEEAAPIHVPVASADAPMQADRDGLFLTMDMPGIKLADLAISFHKGRLSIEGERKKKDLSAGTLRRVFSIRESAIDVAELEAFLLDGVLTLTAPAKPATPTKKVNLTPEETKKEPKTASDDMSDDYKKEKEFVVVETVDDKEN